LDTVVTGSDRNGCGFAPPVIVFARVKYFSRLLISRWGRRKPLPRPQL